MEVPWRFHGGSMEVPWRFDVDFMEVLKAPVSTLVDAGLIEVPWRIDGGFKGSCIGFLM